MIIIRPTVWPVGEPPHYLVSDDVATYLADPASVTALSRVGIPIVLIQNLAFGNLIEALNPAIEHPLTAFLADVTEPKFVPINDPIVDGGAPNTVYFAFTHDGGSAGTTEFSDLVIDGGTGYV